jgi:endonuclease/exonuclease/phosphatase family metal-dependent hydrolase
MLKKIVSGAACALAAVVTTALPATATTATPSSLRATAATPTSLTVAWNAVSGASAYRVQLSTSSTMSSPTYARFNATSGVVRNLTPKKRYYFRVSALDASGTRVSAYTGPTYPSAVTAAVPVPQNVRVTDSGSTSLSLAWTASEGAQVYRVASSKTPDFAVATWTRSYTPAVNLTGLDSDSTYYVKVRVINSDGTVVTLYSTPISTRTDPASTIPPSAAGPVDIRVGSFNVVTVSGDTAASGNRHTWKERRPTVIKQILGEDVDVVGVQEANQSYTFASRLVDGGTQFLDLKNGLNSAGGTYALTNENSYNCVNPTTSYKCVYKDQGASGGDRILYNTSTLELVSQGSYQYQHQNATTPTVTYALAYAVLRVKATGAKFLFTTTHLDPPDRTVRVAQWHELINKVNALKGNLPVVNVGDYNTQKFDVICQEMLPAMKSAGYGDVLNQQYAVNPVANPRAQRTINGWVNSNNKWDSNVANYSYSNNRVKTGNNIDWIFATNSLPVKEFKMVTNFDPTSLQVQGIMPSDHNMLRATITLP